MPFVALPLTWAYAGDFIRLAIFLAITSAALYSTTGLPAEADAAFSATTANRDLGWKVSATLAHRVKLTSPGEAVRGTAALTAALENTDGQAYSVRIEYAAAGTTTWSTICTDASAPYTCSWATSGLANGKYDLRAVATSGSTTLTSPVVKDTIVDNAAPTVTMQDPGTPLRGTATFAATAADAHAGVARVVVQYALSGSSTYLDLCSTPTAPYSCRFDTSTLADGTATASSTSGISSVRTQGAPAGTTGWTDLCTDTSAPYSCSYNTTNAADGLHDLRAILTDGTGRTTTSATVANRRVDNTAPRASDVQTSRLPLGGSQPPVTRPRATTRTATPGSPRMSPGLHTSTCLFTHRATCVQRRFGFITWETGNPLTVAES